MTILYLDTNELLKARKFMLHSKVEFPYFYKLRITNYLKNVLKLNIDTLICINFFNFPILIMSF